MRTEVAEQTNRIKAQGHLDACLCAGARGERHGCHVPLAGIVEAHELLVGRGAAGTMMVHCTPA